jgi:hypothetical protein
MANLGAIGKSVSSFSVIEFPFYARADIAHRLNKDGSLVGHVVENNSTPIVNCAVFLFWRKTMARVGRTFTDKNGDYRFDGIDTDTNQYVAVVQDPDGGVQYNDQIRALAVPV